MSEQNKKPDSDFLSRFAAAISVVSVFFGKLIISGIWRKNTWTKNVVKFWGCYFLIVPLFVYAPSWDIPRIMDHLPWIFPHGLGAWVYLHVARWAELSFLYFIAPSLWLATIGAYSTIKVIRYQRALDHLGMKTSTDLKPIVVDSIPTGESQKKLIVKAVGIDIAEFKNKKGALESSFNAIIEDIRVCERNRQLFEILIAEKALPQLVLYDKVAMRFLAKPYTFLVGESLGGFIVGDLLDIHHMIVAGSTGGGKSFFFKQALIGLAESSKHIQFYLIDLKHGVEMKLFERLENVRIAKEAPEAIVILTAVVAEMESRFQFLEKNNLTEIVPERDKKDRIVIGIDEASVLFTIEKSSKSTKAAAESARDLTDRIAKLGRAAAIHLVLATQKVVKETIDTRVQTNINARMVFRVNTLASSMTVLGNKLASELPEIKGRGVWSVGSRDIIVQVPRLVTDEITERIEILMEKFNGKAKQQFGPMLEIKKLKQKEKAVYSKAESASNSSPTSTEAIDAN